MAFFLVLVLGSKIFMSTDKYYLSNSEQFVHRLHIQIEQKLEEKYPIKTIGTSVAMPGGIVKELGLEFQAQGPLSQRELRTILINAAQDFLSYVNADKEINPYLQNHMFQIENIEIIIFIMGPDGKRVEDPNIGIALIKNGDIEYLTLITTDIPVFKTEIKETYEEALKALKNQ